MENPFTKFKFQANTVARSEACNKTNAARSYGLPALLYARIGDHSDYETSIAQSTITPLIWSSLCCDFRKKKTSVFVLSEAGASSYDEESESEGEADLLAEQSLPSYCNDDEEDDQDFNMHR